MMRGPQNAEPCPFCNSTKHLFYGQSEGGDWAVACGYGCGANGPQRATKHLAKAAWNKRVKEAKP